MLVKYFSFLNKNHVILSLSLSFAMAIYGEEAVVEKPVDIGIPVENITEIPKLDQATITDMYALQVSQLDGILMGAQQLLQIIIMNPSKYNAPASLAWLKDFIKVCMEIQKKNNIVVSLTSCDQLSRATARLADLLESALQTKFTALASPQDVLSMRARPIEASPEDVLDSMKVSHERVEALKQKIEHFGITWFQRNYSNFRSAMSYYEVWNKTKTVAGITAGIGVAGFCIGYLIVNLMDSNKAQKKDIKFAGFFSKFDGVKKFIEKNLMDEQVIIGQDRRPVKRGLTKKLPNEDEKGRENFVAVTDKSHNQILVNATAMQINPYIALPFTAFFTGLNFLGDASRSWTYLTSVDEKLEVSKKIKTKFEQFDGWLRGVKIPVKDGIQYITHITLNDPEFKYLRNEVQPFKSMLEFLENPKKFIAAGRKIPMAHLLTGGSGQGKTFLVQGFVGSVNEQNERLGNPDRFQILTIEPQDLISWGDNAVKRIFEEAKAHAPCVVWLDELHIAGGPLQANGNSPLLAQFLPKLDELNNNEDVAKAVIFIAATNRDDLIDMALKRPGRFNVIKIEGPSFEERIHILRLLGDKKAYNLDAIDFELIARITEGCSRSMMRKIFDRADFIALYKGQQLKTEHLYQAVDELVRLSKPESYLNEQEQQIVAAYQAGAALAQLLCNVPEQLESVTIQGYSREVVERNDWHIKPEDKKAILAKQHKPKYGRVYTCSLSEKINVSTNEHKRERCKVLLSGFAAQKILLGASGTYRKKDRQRALQLAQEIVLDGLLFEELSKRETEAMKDRALQLLKECEQEIYSTLLKNKELLIKLSALLQEKKSVRVDEIKKLMA